MKARALFFCPANKDDPRQTHILFGAAGRIRAQGSDDRRGTALRQLQRRRKALFAHVFRPASRGAHKSVRRGRLVQSVWKAHDEIAEYGLRAPKYLEFKADDGTVLYGRLLLPPESSGSGKIPAHREYLWRPGGTDGNEGRSECFR